MSALVEQEKQESPHVKTSLVEVTDQLPQRPPCRVFFKNEYEQPSGSFKLRGIGNLIRIGLEDATRMGFGKKDIEVFASSGGNAGLAAAYSAKFYGLACTVVLPVVSKPEVRKKLEEFGAKTVVFGNNIFEADKYLQTVINSIPKKEKYPIYCHPFDNSLIWDGHASMVDEVFQEQLHPSDRGNVKGLVCSIGGGGLYNGIYKGLKQNCSKSEILLMETVQAPTFLSAIRADKVVQLETVNSVATSLACSYSTEQSLDNYRNRSQIQTHIESIDDLESIKGSVEYYDNFGRPLEPACGAAVSVAYNQSHALTKHFKNLKSSDIVVIVVCGGSCTNESGITEFKRQLIKQCKL